MTGIVRVLSTQCATCIFRPGNLMSLNPGRLADMVRSCKEKDGHIPCHETFGDEDEPDEDGGENVSAGHSVLEPGPAAICAGFAERYEPTILQLARRLNVVSLVPSPHLDR